MWWRAAVVVLLAAIAGLLAWDRDRVVGMLPGRGTPHEAYVRALESAGLADTALVRDWIAAADAALRSPTKSSVPLAVEIRHAPAEPRAYGYQLDLRRGLLLQVALTVEAEAAPARVFIDVFRMGDAGGPERVVSAEEDALGLEHEIDRDGTYIVRIQPELLRGGPLRITNRTTASLTFPVAGRDAAAVRSFFRDPRDAGRREHHGVDIFAPRDTPVVAASDGFVSSVGTNRLGGNVVWVWDPARRQSQYYAHLSRQAVRTGERLRAGDLVGYVGNTGNARGTPPHLHFGIYAFQEGPIDPLPFVSGGRGPQPPDRASDSPAGANPPHRTTGIGG
jgi:murein DD-endopeptidase MepM/ murein hydrolase activator NlpD